MVNLSICPSGSAEYLASGPPNCYIFHEGFPVNQLSPGKKSMPMKRKIWQPGYTVTPETARALMEIESAREALRHVTLPAGVAEKLRFQARVRSTHYSTRIEGNRLTLEEARQVIEGRVKLFHGRERDTAEVRHYWEALDRAEEWAAEKREFTTELIMRLHSRVEKGPRAKPTPFRDGQNVIRDSGTGRLVYLPPEAGDVPGLMDTFTAWVRKAEKEALPVPLLAGLAHYQFVTIHPYFDGNGRTGRLIATFLLMKHGYGLDGFFSLEEHHARDLEGYYRALSAHPNHNYYEGRETADLTPWLSYFVTVLNRVFQTARQEVEKLAVKPAPVPPGSGQAPDGRARRVMGLFADRSTITSNDVAALLGLSSRSARLLLSRWVAEGWLEKSDTSKKARAYRLSRKNNV
jgi:Fic family protein